jgi:hypothetical protein
MPMQAPGRRGLLGQYGDFGDTAAEKRGQTSPCIEERFDSQTSAS